MLCKNMMQLIYLRLYSILIIYYKNKMGIFHVFHLTICIEWYWLPKSNKIEVCGSNSEGIGAIPLLFILFQQWISNHIVDN